MATGAVISSRSFGSLLVTGKKHKADGITANDRELHLFSISRRHPYVARQTSFQLGPNSAVDKIIVIERLKFFGEMERPFPNSLGNFFGGNLSCDSLERRCLTKTECCLSSDSRNNGWLRPRKLDNLGLSDILRDQSEYRLGIRTHADFKSEPYEITGSQKDSINSSEAPNEAVLLGGDVKSHWWEKQFPKRWLIVLLCFSAFLLCNMDRVNMSIAILPMSAEFNWNPATVGLIQSSFFWGYLLTQIVGGIWADKIGGKLVLGFGVVWWSIATILTPIAARIGLPFLLVIQAFMGIGEGVAMPAMNNILSKWIPVSERSRSLALVYSGMYLGSVIGLAFSPILIHNLGWPSVFYAFGSLGSVWFALWQSKGVLLGLSNTAGVLAGVFGTAATGYILQRGSWDDVFKVSVALYIVETLVWNFFSTGEKILD